MSARRAMISAAFRERYGRSPTTWSRAPGRVDLMGSHTDYNQGFVMTMTVDRDTWIAAAPREDQQVAIHSLNVPGGATFSLASAIKYDHDTPWTNYVRGVAAMLQAAGFALTGFDGLVHSTVPFGSGLSSSAALEMAAALLFRHFGGLDLDPLAMALLGQRAENEFVGVSTGILDQYSSVMGQEGCAILLDCRSLTHDVVPLNPAWQVVIADTRATRNLVGTEYDERREQCAAGVRLLQRYYPLIDALRDVTPAMFAAHEAALPEVIARRCRFIIAENQRVLDLGQVLPASDPQAVQDLFAASYRGARDLYEIGAPAMAAMIRALTAAPGVIAARQAGAGFGGSMVALIEAGQVEPFKAFVTRAYQDEGGITPEIFPVTAAAGAAMIVE